jgi:hypothetical protein
MSAFTGGDEPSGELIFRVATSFERDQPILPQRMENGG